MEYLITGKSEEKNEDLPIVLEYYELNEQGKELLMERATELKKLGYIKSNKSEMVSA